MADDDSKNPSRAGTPQGPTQKEVLADQMRRSRLAQRNSNADASRESPRQTGNPAPTPDPRVPRTYPGMEEELTRRTGHPAPPVDPSLQAGHEKPSDAARDLEQVRSGKILSKNSGHKDADNKFSPGDLVVLISCALFAEPFCHAAADAFLHEHYDKAILGFAIGLPPGLAGGTFHWWKQRIGEAAQKAAIPVALALGIAGAILAFAYIAGPEIYQRAVAPQPPPVAPVVTGFTQQQVDEKIAAATKALRDQLAEAQKQLAATPEEIAKATTPLNAKIAELQTALEDMTRQRDAASQITTVSVEKLPTKLRLLFKGDDVEEIEAKNIIWTKLVTTHEQKIQTLLGERSNSVLVWAIILIFKKPITFKEIYFDDHGAGLPKPEITSSSTRHAVIEFASNFGYQNVFMDIIVK